MTITEENVVSLRTAIFKDDGILGQLVLLPPMPDRRPDAHLHSDVCFVYKRDRPSIGRSNDARERRHLALILKHMKALVLEVDPKISFLWSDNGQSVAVLVNGEPMGFILEDKFCGYSKAVKNSEIMNPWDEELFQKTFHDSE
jgi:hypothetical protein